MLFQYLSYITFHLFLASFLSLPQKYIILSEILSSLFWEWVGLEFHVLYQQHINMVFWLYNHRILPSFLKKFLYNLKDSLHFILHNHPFRNLYNLDCFRFRAVSVHAHQCRGSRRRQNKNCPFLICIITAIFFENNYNINGALYCIFNVLLL